METTTLPSGKTFKFTIGSFAESKDLYQAVLEELKTINLSGDDELNINIFKNVFCTLLASKEVEEKLSVCMSRVVYDGQKFSVDLFEETENRQDYIPLCYKIAWENILPFVQGLYAELSGVGELIGKLNNFQE